MARLRVLGGGCHKQEGKGWRFRCCWVWRHILSSVQPIRTKKPQAPPSCFSGADVSFPPWRLGTRLGEADCSLELISCRQLLLFLNTLTVCSDIDTNMRTFVHQRRNRPQSVCFQPLWRAADDWWSCHAATSTGEAGRHAQVSAGISPQKKRPSEQHADSKRSGWTCSTRPHAQARALVSRRPTYRRLQRINKKAQNTFWQQPNGSDENGHL